MIREIKTSSDHADFQILVAALDEHLAEIYGEEKDFFSKHNKIDNIKNVILVYDDEVPVGCGGIKEYSSTVTEIKRMYVKPEYRGRGIASAILSGLEDLAVLLGYSKTILETLVVKNEAIKMYSKNGYQIIPNYGQYENVKSSICMAKDIINYQQSVAKQQ